MRHSADQLALRMMKTTLIVGCLSLPGSTSLAKGAATNRSRAGLSDQELTAVRDGYEDRVAELFATRAGKPLVKGRIHSRSGERPAGTNRFAYSLTEHAAVNLWRNQDVDTANAALADYGTYFVTNPDSVYDRDNFHWHSEAALRLIDFYGRNGSRDS